MLDTDYLCFCYPFAVSCLLCARSINFILDTRLFVFLLSGRGRECLPVHLPPPLSHILFIEQSLSLTWCCPLFFSAVAWPGTFSHCYSFLFLALLLFFAWSFLYSFSLLSLQQARCLLMINFSFPPFLFLSFATMLFSFSSQILCSL